MVLFIIDLVLPSFAVYALSVVVYYGITVVGIALFSFVFRFFLFFFCWCAECVFVICVRIGCVASCACSYSNPVYFTVHLLACTVGVSCVYAHLVCTRA